MPPRKPTKDDDNPPTAGAVSGLSTSTFRVLRGCDWGAGYKPAGSIVKGVPAKVAAVWLADEPPVLERVNDGGAD